MREGEDSFVAVPLHERVQQSRAKVEKEYDSVYTYLDRERAIHMHMPICVYEGRGRDWHASANRKANVHRKEGREEERDRGAHREEKTNREGKRKRSTPQRRQT